VDSGAHPTEADFTDEELLCPSSVSRTRIMAVLYVCAGLYGAYQIRSANIDGLEVVMILPILAIFAGIGTAVYRGGTRIDLQAGTVFTWQRLGPMSQETPHALDQVDAVELRTEERGLSTGRLRVHVVRLIGDKLGAAIWVGQSVVHEQAKARATALAARLSLPLREGGGA
jgi:hypothetical protein